MRALTRSARMVGLALTLACAASAQSGPGLRPNSDSDADVGDGWFALPALHRVPLLSGGKPGVAVALSLGYGSTPESAGSHHRMLALPAVGWVAAPWLELGLQADSRYDLHPGNDSGITLDPRAVARLGTQVLNQVQLGLELGAWVPGSQELATSLEATSPEALAFSALRSPPFTVAGYAGYRLDNSSKAGRNAPNLSEGDRLALGLSEFDSVLSGVGAAYRTGGVVFLAEASSELLLGKNAPDFVRSPLRASLGARYFASPQLQLEMMAVKSLSDPPEVIDGQPLVIIEPRFTALLGIRYRFVADPVEITLEPPAPLLRPKPAARPKGERSAKPTTRLVVAVLDQNGEPFTDANLVLVTAQGEQMPELGPEGQFVFAKLALGAAELKVSASGFKPSSRQLQLGKDPESIKLQLEGALTGQVRGLIRTFGGTGVEANVRIEPGSIQANTDVEGFFEVDIEPGSYEVKIEAEGYVPQSRKISVSKNEVVILNADLFKRR